MMRFVVWFKQGGHGCDYTIACGQKLEWLPERIDTMKEAHAYVLEDTDSPTEAQANYYGGIEDMEHIIVFELEDWESVDITGLMRAKAEEKARKEAEKEEKEARKQFEALQKRFGKK